MKGLPKPGCDGAGGPLRGAQRLAAGIRTHQGDHVSPETQAGAQAEYRTEKEGLELNLRQDNKKLGEFLGN